MTAPGKPGPKERRFLDALRDIFVGVKVDGQSGFINLMRIKAAYFQKVVEPELMKDIAKALNDFPEFREELFDKLYSFFSRYFSRSGSSCFAYTPQHMVCHISHILQAVLVNRSSQAGHFNVNLGHPFKLNAGLGSDNTDNHTLQSHLNHTHV
jgi:hypothetical protein